MVSNIWSNRFPLSVANDIVSSEYIVDINVHVRGQLCIIMSLFSFLEGNTIFSNFLKTESVTY